MKRKKRFPVADLMHHPVVTLTMDSKVGELLALAESKHINHFPVVDGDRAIGFVCACDVRGALPEEKVWKFARCPPVSMSPGGSAREAARLMNEYGVGSVVVRDDDGVSGIVTRNDLSDADPSLAELLSESRCVCCGANTHLRVRSDGLFRCIECEERLRGSDWFDFGVAD